MLNIHAAKTQLSGILTDIERRGVRYVICRDGQPVADLVPHRPINRMVPNKKLGAIRMKFAPDEDLSPRDWPTAER